MLQPMCCQVTSQLNKPNGHNKLLTNECKWWDFAPKDYVWLHQISDLFILQDGKNTSNTILVSTVLTKQGIIREMQALQDRDKNMLLYKCTCAHVKALVLLLRLHKDRYKKILATYSLKQSHFPINGMYSLVVAISAGHKLFLPGRNTFLSYFCPG